MGRFRVGVQLHPQATTVAALRDAWRAADGLGVDSIWIWDHFFPLYGDPNAAHFEAYTLLGAMAVETERAQIGALVTCNPYRNANLLADMARTIDHLSGGRFVLGIGSGWFERDFDEYGYEFGTAPSRLRDLDAALPVIMDRFAMLEPGPTGRLPILVGGAGEKVTLRIVAEHADAWNSFGPPARYAEKNKVLNEWCARLDRNPRTVERTVAINASEVDDWQAYLDAGAEHIIVMAGPPFDLEPVRALVKIANS
ncbi:MAG: LLM class F420-dependent oxidoreductase [Actinomycetota bacterium]|nr:LLM class F420-dependent oxidoreductase [Actinomycetota bacterium]